MPDFDKSFYDELPSDWENPIWPSDNERCFGFGDWKRHASRELINMWPQLDLIVRKVIAHNLQQVVYLEPDPNEYPDD